MLRSYAPLICALVHVYGLWVLRRRVFRKEHGYCGIGVLGQVCHLFADVVSHRAVTQQHADGDAGDGPHRPLKRLRSEVEQDEGEGWEGEIFFCLGQEHDAPAVREAEGSEWPPDF